MKFELKSMFGTVTDEEFDEWDSHIDDLINEYRICVDTIESEDEYEIELWCYDDDLARLFSDSGIGIGKSFNVEKEFKVDNNYQPVGLDYGDYIETVELHQSEKTYLVPVYCAYKGAGAYYAFALFKAEKKLDKIKGEQK